MAMIKSKNSIRILIIEDDKSIREVLKDLLTSDKTELLLAPDGESALPYLEEGRIDLLITDLGLPGISGWEVAIIAKKYLPELRLVAITSWRGSEVEKRMAESDLDAVIWKPFKLNHVCQTLNKIIPGFIKDYHIAQ